VQAAISALHAEAPSSAATDWSEIVALYDLLLRTGPSPVVELNRAVAIAMRDGPAAGLSQIEGLLANGKLDNYPLAHSAKAELCRRVGQMDEAKASFEKALALTSQEQQRRLLERRFAAIK
jgi:RNA polymerase sigma-70 factor (ECF subfamily)